MSTIKSWPSLQETAFTPMMILGTGWSDMPPSWKQFCSSQARLMISDPHSKIRNQLWKLIKVQNPEGSDKCLHVTSRGIQGGWRVGV